jgi:hypothetical protein
MHFRKAIGFAAVVVGAALGFGSAAFAQAPPATALRTWVSGVGDDVSTTCARTDPCKTFQGAIAKTTEGGEINCMDPGGFGAVTITKSITIDCTGTLGSELNAGTSGFLINDAGSAAPGTANVILRGLVMNGAPGTGVNGVRFLSGNSLLLEDVMIMNQKGNAGVSITPSGPIAFTANNVTIANGGIGILVQPTGSGSVRGALSNVRVDSNSAVGFRADTTGLTSGAGIRMAISDSVFSRNGGGVAVIGPAGAVPSIIVMDRVVTSGNVGHGMAANGPTARAAVGRSTITGNGTGVLLVSGGRILTYSTNKVAYNDDDGAFTSAIPPQ